MKLVVLGAKGMLGTDLVSACREGGMEGIGLDLPEVDITHYESVLARMPAADAVINCAAYTRVDDAESHREQVFSINAEGSRNVARVCREKNIPLLHISTDYVFDGSKGQPYTEQDAPHPLNLYGASKLAGEKAIGELGGAYLIVRTQSLFGRHGHSFVRTILRRLRESDQPLRVVNDQISAPTYTPHLADAILNLLRMGRRGIVHVAASGECSWFVFAQAIARRVKPAALVLPIASQEYRAPASRPAYSVFDMNLFRKWTDRTMPSWQEGLADYLTKEGY